MTLPQVEPPRSWVRQHGLAVLAIGLFVAIVAAAALFLPRLLPPSNTAEQSAPPTSWLGRSSTQSGALA
jgi:hypothetical protein